MDVQEKYSHFTWLLDNPQPSKPRLPLGKGGKVMSSHHPLSHPCCGWKVAVTIPEPSWVLVQGHLPALLLQESSQGDPDPCKGSVGGTEVIKEVKDAVHSSLFWSCWKVHVSLRGWPHLRKSGFKQGWVSTCSLLQESSKDECSMCYL